jgi:DNA polymerase-1
MIIAIDTESTGLSTWRGDRPFAISICWEDESIQYWEFEVNPKTREIKIQDVFYISNFIEIIEDEKIEKVFHHDMRMLESINVNVKGKIHDTSIAARCTNTLEDNVKLKYLSRKYLGMNNDDEEELQKAVMFYRKKAKGLGYKIGDKVQEDYWIPKLFDKGNELCEKYCCLDSIRCMRLHKFYQEAMKEFKVKHTYEKELELLHILYEMEGKGLYTSLDRINRGIEHCLKKSLELEQEVFRKWGTTNLDSPKQLGPYLRDKMSVPIIEKTPSGEIATGLPILKRYTDYSPGLELLFKRAAYETVRGYYENYRYHYTDGFIHGSLKQFDTKTFRLSSVDPNLQNIANPETSGGNISYIREDELVNARSCFGPRPGKMWLVIDYKQLELRIFASRGKVKKLVKVFLDGGDPHETTRISCPFLAAMPPKQGRKIAKNTNFTVINVGGANALYEKYAIPIEQGEIVVKEFKAVYEETSVRAKECEQFAKQYGYILNAYNDKIFVDREFAYRGTSYDIQSSAARLIKRAMLNLQKYFKERQMDTIYLLLQIHDELIIEMDLDDYNDVIVGDIKDIMENHGGAFVIPTPVDVSLCFENWSKKLEWKPNGSNRISA